MKFVKIQCNGEMSDLDKKIDMRNIYKTFTNLASTKGTHKIKHLYTWNYEDSIIVCYGWSDGGAGNENKHDLPPNGEIILDGLDSSDTQLLFGDLYVCIKKKNKLCDIDVSDYSLFYSICFDGFHDCSDEESDNEESDNKESDNASDEGSLVDFIEHDVSDNTCSDEDFDMDQELDEDDNEY